MGVLTRLITRIRRGQALRRAQEAREVAWQAWCEAKHRGDTRRQNETHRQLRAATTACLKVELGR